MKIRGGLTGWAGAGMALALLAQLAVGADVGASSARMSEAPSTSQGVSGEEGVEATRVAAEAVTLANLGTGWRLVFAGSPQRVVRGSVAELQRAVKAGKEISIEIPTVHGLTAVACRTAYETDGSVACEFELWCDGPAVETIPARHKHVGIASSTGEVQQIIAVATAKGEEKMLHVSSSSGGMAWYAR